MEKYKIPSLFKIETASQFFKEFIELNKIKRNFSQRGISQKLQWPASYIPDLIKKRKKFTLSRAIQFSHKFDLDTIDMEKLIYLSIFDMKLLEPQELAKLKKNKHNFRHEPTQDFDLLDAKIFLVLECVKWLKGTATFEKIKDLTSRQGLSEIDIVNSLEMLKHKKIIKIIKDKYSILQDGIKSDDYNPTAFQVAQLHITFSQFFQSFMKNPIGPAVYNSAIVHLDREKFEQIADKVIAIRNWILEIANKDGKLGTEKDVRLFQLDLNLVPIFSKDTAFKYRKK